MQTGSSDVHSRGGWLGKIGLGCARVMRAGRGLRWRVGRWRPHRETYWILVREMRGESLADGIAATEAAPTSAPSGGKGVRVEWVRSAADAAFGDVARMSETLGIDAEWCAEKLRGGDSMVVAFVERAAAAMAWVGRGRLWVDNICHLVAHAADECSFYNDLVLPEFRGRRLQRLLIQERMRVLSGEGMGRVYSVVRVDNAPSVRSYLAEGFRTSGRVDLLSANGRTGALVRRVSNQLPIGRLEFDGWRVGGGLHLIRGRLD